MHREKNKLYKKRIEAFYKRIKGELIETAIPFAVEFSHSRDPVPFSDRLKGEYAPIKEGENWGKEWDSGWFRLTGEVPVDWKGRTVVAQLNFNGEALIFDNGGCPVYGLSNGSVFDESFDKEIYHLFTPAIGGEAVELCVEAAANHLFGIDTCGDPKPGKKIHGDYTGTLLTARLCVFNEEVWHLMLDLEVLISLIEYLPEKSVRRSRIIKAINDAINIYGNDTANAGQAREVLKKTFDTPANASDMNVVAVGHAHIDTGWLWPVRESIRKCGRTFSSQIALLEQYPEYVFGASQAQHYQFTKEHYPELYKKIKKYVKEGRWEIQGGTWVECDCNVISGESMVRQFIHGKNFYMDEFGVDVKNLWLPDVFGYSAAMPQILKRSGVDFFLTQKISWSQFNEFPHFTFNWRGIDGSEVVTHFPPENTYNSHLLPDGLGAAQERFSEKDVLNEYMCLFGTGDGGGGPKEEHIERGLRAKDLEGCPKVSFGCAADFFERLVKEKEQLDLWDGELYLEVHRGTYTTQARTKRLNRQLEHKLRQVEFLCSCASPDSYPRAELDGIWKNMLMNQFHDIIPGSSIHMVYETAEEEYAQSLSECDKFIERAGDELFDAEKDSLTLFNCLSHSFTRPIVLPESWNGSGVVDEKGAALPVQLDDGGASVLVELPALGCRTLKKAGSCSEAVTAKDLVLENDLIRYEFKDNGELIRAYDKECEKDILIEKESGNLFSLYVDRPHDCDAWDVDIYYEDELLENARSVKAGPLGAGDVRQGIKFELAIGKSAITQQVFLSVNSKRVDFRTEVEWNELHNMLRVSFPTVIRQSQFASEIQYGYVMRPTHRNTSWDMAKFEVSAHRYVDLSSHDYGVALLNDCKYGHKVYDNVIDLNLLRAPTTPDPIADQGHHEFTYSLFPHEGNLVNSDVQKEAAMLNIKPISFENMNAGNFSSPLSLDSEGISLERLKMAEKGNCKIVRLVETKGRNSKGTLTVDGSCLIETNLMEWTEEKTIDASGPVAIELEPFEIRTYKIQD